MARHVVYKPLGYQLMPRRHGVGGVGGLGGLVFAHSVMAWVSGPEGGVGE